MGGTVGFGEYRPRLFLKMTRSALQRPVGHHVLFRAWSLHAKGTVPAGAVGWVRGRRGAKVGRVAALSSKIKVAKSVPRRWPPEGGKVGGEGVG